MLITDSEHELSCGHYIHANCRAQPIESLTPGYMRVATSLLANQVFSVVRELG